MIKIAACPSKPWRSGANILKLIVNRKWLIVIFLLLLFTIHLGIPALPESASSAYSLFTSAFAPRPAHAQTPPPVPAECLVPADATPQQTIDALNKCAIKKNVFDDKIFNINQISGTTDSIYTILLGNSLLHPETDDVTDSKGAVAAAGHLVAAMYSYPPVSGVQYFASQFQKFNPVQPAYAQSLGFEALSPVQRIWEEFRNIAYLGFVIIFVIMGFMIMFRAHISPQAVATVQDSLPRIVVALILVTFSYAIAGLMVDLMFLLLNIIIKVLENAGFISPGGGDIVFQKSIIGVVTGSWFDVVEKVAKTLSKLIDDVIGISGIPIIGKIINWGISGIGGIVFGIAMLFIMFRVFFMLLMSYVMVLILTLASPFYFLIQALPGNNGAKEWFKQMGANVSVFAVVALMILFAGALSGISSLGGVANQAKLPEDQVLKFPLLSGGFEQGTIINIIAFGVLLMTPEAAKMVKEAIGAKGGPSFGGAGAAALGASAGFLGRRAAESPFGQAASAVGKYRSGQATEFMASKVPSFLGGPGKGKTLKRNIPEWKVE